MFHSCCELSQQDQSTIKNNWVENGHGLKHSKEYKYNKLSELEDSFGSFVLDVDPFCWCNTEKAFEFFFEMMVISVTEFLSN